MNTSLSEQLLDTFKRNPEGLLFLAAGVALLLRRPAGENMEDRDKLPATSGANGGRRKTSQWKQGLTESVDGAREYASETAASMRDAASSARNYAAEAASTATQSASRYAQEAARYSKRLQRKAATTTSRVIRQQPAAVAIAGLAAGVALASLLPKLEMEERALDPVGQRLGEAAQRASERLKEATQEAKERLKSAVDEHGLNKDGLKEVASEVAGAFGNAMSGDSAGGKPKRPTTLDM